MYQRQFVWSLLAYSLAKQDVTDPLLEFSVDPEMLDTSMFILSDYLLGKLTLNKNSQIKYKKL